MGISPLVYHLTMASFDIAFDWLLDSEDPKREYLSVPDAPPGAHAISGINSYSFPTAFNRIAAQTQSMRAPLVKSFYETYFWKYGSIESDEIAKRVFDMAVNAGSHVAIKLIQQALGATVDRDGILGVETLAAINAAPPAELVAAFQRARKCFYESIAAKNLENQKYLEGWLKRCER